jgi:hypothetical protein
MQSPIIGLYHWCQQFYQRGCCILISHSEFHRAYVEWKFQVGAHRGKGAVGCTGQLHGEFSRTMVILRTTLTSSPRKLDSVRFWLELSVLQYSHHWRSGVSSLSRKPVKLASRRHPHCPVGDRFPPSAQNISDILNFQRNYKNFARFCKDIITSWP